MLVPYLAQATTHLGLVPTLSVSEYPPYLLARLVNTLDHVTEGRIGWNCVTGSNDGAAQNYGRDKHRPHDERYDVADEFADVVTRLWEAWEPDAVVLDRENQFFADGARSIRSTTRASTSRCAGRSTRRARRRAACRSARPAARRAGRSSPRAGPTPSSPKAAAVRRR